MSSSEDGWSSDKILTIASAASMMIYGMYLLCEHISDSAAVAALEEERQASRAREGLPL